MRQLSKVLTTVLLGRLPLGRGRLGHSAVLPFPEFARLHTLLMLRQREPMPAIVWQESLCLTSCPLPAPHVDWPQQPQATDKEQRRRQDGHAVVAAGHQRRSADPPRPQDGS